MNARTLAARMTSANKPSSKTSPSTGTTSMMSPTRNIALVASPMTRTNARRRVARTGSGARRPVFIRPDVSQYADRALSGTRLHARRLLTLDAASTAPKASARGKLGIGSAFVAMTAPGPVAAWVAGAVAFGKVAGRPLAELLSQLRSLVAAGTQVPSRTTAEPVAVASGARGKGSGRWVRLRA